MKTVTKKMLKDLTILQLIEKIMDLTDSEPISVTGQGKEYIAELASRLSLTPEQALFLAVFVDQSNDHNIELRDLARHFSARTTSILSRIASIDELTRRKFVIRRKDKDGDVYYRVPNETIECLREGHAPNPDKVENLTANDWIDRVEQLLKLRKHDEIDDKSLEAELQTLFDLNQHLKMVQIIQSNHLVFTDKVLLFAIAFCYLNEHDDRVVRSDIDDYFCNGVFRRHCEALENGNHTLMSCHLIEQSCHEGQIEPDHWCLTEYCKQEVFAELGLQTTSSPVRSNLTAPESITPKKLYYNERVTRQVNELKSLLEPERMNRILKRLSDQGMRRGFSCLFYGAPGTGKTETALQLARLTGRYVMQVDVPSIRSKWVGETEKNIKQLFDRYRRAAQSAINDPNGKEGAPILLFNEADALLNKRNEGSVDSVDKMENAMQNIILQEMENLEGIMIATTNLTGSLDSAFERRFLYKIEFDKPKPAERRHIWQAMLPDLNDTDALTLAEQFDFSGGQIENIARKRVIGDILAERDSLDLESIIESCKTESLDKKSTKRIGFDTRS